VCLVAFGPQKMVMNVTGMLARMVAYMLRTNTDEKNKHHQG
jgi:hypothetical protein